MFVIRTHTAVLCVLFSAYFILADSVEAFASESNEEVKLLQAVDKLLFQDAREPMPASVSASIGWDSESGKNYFTSLDLPVFEQRLLMSGGKNTALNSEIDEEESSTSFSIGVFSDGREKLGLGVEYRTWKFEDIVEINALRGTIELNFPDVVFSLTPQFRNIAFKDTLTVAGVPREVEVHIDSTGFNSSITIFMPADIWLAGAYASHKYNDEIFFAGARRSFFEIVQQEETLIRLSPGVLNNTYGLEKTRTSASIGMDFDVTGISVGYSESVSAVDEEKTTTTDGSIYWRPDKHWRISLSGGVQGNSINSDQSSFGNVSLRYRF